MTTDTLRAGCSAVPAPTGGTVERPAAATGTPRGTPAEQPSLKALARKVLRAEHPAEQTRNTYPETPPEKCSIWRNGGTPSGTPTADCSEQRTRLIAAAIAQGIQRTVVAALDDLDVSGCEWLDDAGLRRYAQIVHENHLRAHGVAILRPLELAKSSPRTAITCATCAHQQRKPDTSEAGMHGCAKGHGLHHGHARHVCPDWKPAP